jgi:hypothetical protein
VTETKGLAVSWVQALQARGVVLSVRNNRLWLRPENAYKQQSDEELLTLRHHRREIIDIVRSGVCPAPAAQPAPPVPAPEVLCAYCGNRKCVGPDHSAYSTLHHQDPSEIDKRNKAATREMWMSFGIYRSPYGP